MIKGNIMSFRNLTQPYRSKFTLQPINSKLNKVSDKLKNVELPERFKGTFVEKWAKYWKNMFEDYKDVAIEIAKSCKERPIRASIYGSLLVSGFYLSSHNPDECNFKIQLYNSTEKVMLVPESIRNPVSENYVKWLDRCYNEGIVRRLNLGLFSVIWLDNYDELCSLYKAVCPYLKPRYVTFYERIIDIGVLNKWWILENKMKDYDVNDAEFASVTS